MYRHATKFAVSKLTVSAILAVAFLLTTTTAFAGRASSEGSYHLPVTHHRVVDWMEHNRPRYYKAANAEIIETRGEHHYLVRSTSPLGSSTYVVRETRVDTDHGTSYHIQMVKPVSGRVTEMESTVAIEGHGKKTQVHMSVLINFRHLLASNGRVKSIANKSVSRTRKLLTGNVR